MESILTETAHLDDPAALAGTIRSLKTLNDELTALGESADTTPSKDSQSSTSHKGKGTAFTPKGEGSSGMGPVPEMDDLLLLDEPLPPVVEGSAEPTPSPPISILDDVIAVPTEDLMDSADPTQVPQDSTELTTMYEGIQEYLDSELSSLADSQRRATETIRSELRVVITNMADLKNRIVNLEIATRATSRPVTEVTAQVASPGLKPSITEGSRPPVKGESSKAGGKSKVDASTKLAILEKFLMDFPTFPALRALRTRRVAELSTSLGTSAPQMDPSREVWTVDGLKMLFGL
jgi:hypothetical protein